MTGLRGLFAVLLAVGHATASAQTPLGSEFRLDTLANLGGHTRAARHAAFLPTGEFVVVWEARDMPGGQLADVRGRVFSASGVPRGAEFTVNTTTAGEQVDPEVVATDSGAFIVVWTGWPTGGSNQIYARRFDPSGSPLGAEFRVSSATTGFSHRTPSVAAAPGGGFVVVWAGPDGYSLGVLGRRYAADGTPVGSEFVVNLYVQANGQTDPSVDMDGAGNFVVAWGKNQNPPVVKARMFSAAGAPLGPDFQVNAPLPTMSVQPRVGRSRDGSFMVVWHGNNRILGRRYDPSGSPLGSELVVAFQNLNTMPHVAASADGDFVVSWHADDGYFLGPFARRYDASGAAGPVLRANSHTTGIQAMVSVASDPAGNFVVTWRYSPAAPTAEFRAQRYAAGLSGAALAVDSAAGPTSDGNRVLEAGETVPVEPSWLNAGSAAATFTGAVTSFTGPGTSGNPSYTIADGAADYGTVAANSSVSCTSTGNCYQLGITIPSVRPAVHWDARLHEELSPATLGAARTWDVHVGESFTDVPRSSPFYRDVETLLHHGVTAGCAAGAYCPATPVTREQLAAFVLVARDRAAYVPPACGATPTFADVPISSPFCPWIEELARRGVVAGCGGGNYCPSAAVSREQIATFVLRAFDPAISPPACVPPNVFADVPETSPFCPWIEELAARGVVSGCGGGNYCPVAPVTREQMGAFLSLTFGLQLYGP